MAQGRKYLAVEIEESMAYLFTLHRVKVRGHDRVIVESDCLTLVSKLRKREIPNNFLGIFFIYDILKLCSMFNFISFANAKRERGIRSLMLWLISNLIFITRDYGWRRY